MDKRARVLSHRRLAVCLASSGQSERGPWKAAPALYPLLPIALLEGLLADTLREKESGSNVYSMAGGHRTDSGRVTNLLQRNGAQGFNQTNGGHRSLWQSAQPLPVRALSFLRNSR